MTNSTVTIEVPVQSLLSHSTGISRDVTAGLYHIVWRNATVGKRMLGGQAYSQL